MSQPEISIIFEDSEILVVNKPNDLIVHQSKFGGKIDNKSLCQILHQQIGQPVYPVHRLDRKTSGVLLLSKNKANIPRLQAQFTDQTINKKYIALVRGHVLDSGSVDTPIKPEGKTIYKSALTLFKPIDHIEVDIAVPPYSTARYTLMELSPKTGRTHQLRKHMNKISHPIIGDPKYGNRHHNHMFEKKLEISKLFLHALQLRVQHPETNESLIFEADLPSFWTTMFQQFNWITKL